MGIGPGGSDLSQFFNNREKQAVSQAKHSSGVRQPTGSNHKPQTAGTFGTLMMEASEFGAMIPSKDSKQSHMHGGPNITNIGFDVSQ